MQYSKEFLRRVIEKMPSSSALEAIGLLIGAPDRHIYELVFNSSSYANDLTLFLYYAEKRANLIKTIYNPFIMKALSKNTLAILFKDTKLKQRIIKYYFGKPVITKEDMKKALTQIQYNIGSACGFNDLFPAPVLLCPQNLTIDNILFFLRKEREKIKQKLNKYVIRSLLPYGLISQLFREGPLQQLMPRIKKTNITNNKGALRGILEMNGNLEGDISLEYDITITNDIFSKKTNDIFSKKTNYKNSILEKENNKKIQSIVNDSYGQIFDISNSVAIKREYNSLLLIPKKEPYNFPIQRREIEW